MKQRIPWPIKFAIKVAIGITGVDYKLLKRARIVEHGRMEDAGFSVEVFNRHVAAPRRDLLLGCAGVLLELGPGDSIATGVLGRVAGFSEVVLIDAGCFADIKPEAINRLFVSLGDHAHSVKADADPRTVTAQLHAAGISYLTDGLRSLQSIAPGRVSHSFSNSVLQHVYRDELAEFIEALGRAHAAGSLSSHSINFTDHFSGGYVNHRLPGWVMESALIKRANLYTNRVSPRDFAGLFAAAGFAVRRVEVDFYESKPVAFCAYDCAEAFTDGVGSRRVLRAIFLLRKN